MLKKILNYTWIKENLNIVLVIPTVAGGIWQIMELGFIGTPYIRFFSVSQLIADGLLLAFIFFWIFLFFRFFTLKLIQDFRKKETEEVITEQKVINTKMLYFKRIKLFLLLAFQVFYCWFQIECFKVISPDFKNAKTISLFMVVMAEIVLLTILMVSIYFIINLFKLWFTFRWKINFNWSPNLEHPTFNWIFGALSIGLGVGFLVILFYIIPLFHRSFMNSTDFENLKNVECQLKAEYKDLKSCEIEYFNDQYIFVLVQTKSKRHFMKVLKFETLFENSCQL